MQIAELINRTGIWAIIFGKVILYDRLFINYILLGNLSELI